MLHSDTTFKKLAAVLGSAAVSVIPVSGANDVIESVYAIPVEYISVLTTPETYSDPTYITYEADVFQDNPEESVITLPIAGTVKLRLSKFSKREKVWI
jgi:hypothetical protein